MKAFGKVLILKVALLLSVVFGCQKHDYELPDQALLRYSDPECRMNLNMSEAVLVESLHSKTTTLMPDACLFVVARAIAMKMALERDEVNSEEIRKIFLSYGVPDGQIGIRTYTAPTTKKIAKDISNGLSEELARSGYTHFGVGAFRKLYPPRTYAVVAIAKKIVFLEPFPREVFRSEELILSGRIKDGYENPYVLISDPTGEMISKDISKDESGNFEVRFQFDPNKPGTYTVEIEAEGERGPEVAALFSINYMTEGYHPAAELKAQKSAITPDGVISSKNLLLTWINQERESRGIPLLIEDPRLTALAQRRAQRMLLEGKLSHIDAQGLDVAHEVEKKGIKFKRVGENLAFNTDLYQAHKSLMESPSHRKNILDPSFAYVGVGVAIARKKETKQFAVVEIFIEK